ncbi:MAG: phenylacetate--CoA ligase family protein, partial [Chloroflexota bacterium]
MIWDKENECSSRERIRELQLERLKATVARVYERVERYRRLFDQTGVHPDKVKCLEDVRHLPFLTKDELRDYYPYGLFAVPMKEVVRIHASSGTTGRPTVVGYSQRDLDNWSELIARIVTAGGVTSNDVVQVSFGYGLFTGAFGLHQGLERVGATVVPVSSGNTERQVMLMRDFGATGLVCTPSYALHIAEALRAEGRDPHSGGVNGLKLRVGLFGAEPWSENMRREIESKLGISATDNYGLSEVIGPGVAGECECKDGLHINEDHFLVEVVNPDTGEPLPEGEWGELVFTSLTKEAFPVVRYRSRDIARITFEPCRCGRTTARMSRVQGRTDDMLIIRGVNVFPSQIESVLLEVEGTEPHYLLIVERNGNLDELTVHVEVSESIFFDEMRKLRTIQEALRRRIESVLNLKVNVHLAEPKSIERSVGKAKRVIDKRQL